jgi:hypothetical protein
VDGLVEAGETDDNGKLVGDTKTGLSVGKSDCCRIFVGASVGLLVSLHEISQTQEHWHCPRRFCCKYDVCTLAHSAISVTLNMTTSNVIKEPNFIISSNRICKFKCSNGLKTENYDCLK